MTRQLSTDDTLLRLTFSVPWVSQSKSERSGMFFAPLLSRGVTVRNAGGIDLLCQFCFRSVRLVRRRRGEPPPELPAGSLAARSADHTTAESAISRGRLPMPPPYQRRPSDIAPFLLIGAILRPTSLVSPHREVCRFCSRPVSMDGGIQSHLLKCKQITGMAELPLKLIDPAIQQKQTEIPQYVCRTIPFIAAFSRSNCSTFPEDCGTASPHLPMYFAYRLRATPTSVVPLTIARPSGNTVRS